MMVLDDLIDQSQDSDPDSRKQAIIALGRTKDLAALPALARIYREDSVPELRELAKKAGVFIRQQNGNSSADNSTMTAAASGAAAAALAPNDAVNLRVYESPKPQAAADPSVLPARGREYEVSHENRTRAKSNLDSAMSAQMRGDNARALKDLTAALRLNPNLINDSYYASVAALVTGKTGDEAVRMVVDGGERKAFVSAASAQKRRKVKDDHLAVAQQDTWKGAIFEFFIFIVITILLPVLSSLVLIEISKTTLGGLFNSIIDADASRAATAQARQGLATLENMDVFSIFRSTAIGWIFTLVYTLVYTVIFHVVARAFGGAGTISHLFVVYFSFSNRWLPIWYIVLTAVLSLFLFSYFEPLFLGCGGLILAILLIYLTFKSSAKFGAAYKFDGGMGCLANIVTGVIIVVILGAIGFIIAQVAGAALINLIPPELMQTIPA